MTEKPKILYPLIVLWMIFSILFIGVGIYFLELSLNIPIWAASEDFFFYPMLFFGTTMIATTLTVFGCIFLIFSYETFKGKSWVWNAGIIISTIFLVIFSFMLGSSMITVLFFKDDFSIQTLVTIMILFLVDLGIVFLITRPNIKTYLHDQKPTLPA